MTPTHREIRLHRTAEFNFGLAGVIAVLVALLIAWPGYQDLVAKRTELVKLKADTLETESQLAEVRETYRNLKEDYSLRASSEETATARIFPKNVDQTGIVRKIEEFTNVLAQNNWLLLKSINFGKVIEEKDVDYLTIPFRVSVNINRGNLDELLQLFENSGRKNSDKNSVLRLLDVKEVNIQINDKADAYRPGQESKGNTDIDLTVNAYSRLPESVAKKGLR